MIRWLYTRRVLRALARHFRDGRLKTHADLMWEADMWDSIGWHALAEFLRGEVTKERQ